MASQSSPIILWFRRDLRLNDHAALVRAAESKRPVIPLFICDEIVEATGHAPKWRLGLGVAHFAKTLEKIGSKLILRKGNALEVLRDMIAQTGATSVYWSRGYDTDSIARDTAVKAALRDDGIEAQSFAGHLLFEPWTIRNKAGGYFKVYTPYWRNVRQLDVAEPLAPVREITAPENWPVSDNIDDWALDKDMQRGAHIVAKYVTVGEDAAQARLAEFLEDKIASYSENRDVPARDATSGLSENLTYGEISPRMIWHDAQCAFHHGVSGSEQFLKEVVWREFAYHLMYHFPQLAEQNWREQWDAFEWLGDTADAHAWRRGITGEPLVDAGMRELYTTGVMHNRVRMIAASYLTKHLRTDWRIGLKWFEDCLIDWDPAANAMGWQWVAGSGPDASPYYRIFNPQTQAEKFDENGLYQQRFLNPEHAEQAADFYQAIPKSWGMAPTDARPQRIVDLADGRARALAAYQALRGDSE